MSKKPSQASYRKIIAQNKRVRFEYEILETLEAGIILTGSEVKSLRIGKANINEAFADTDGNDLILRQAYIAKYGQASHWNHEEKRPRKLLLHKQQIQRLIGTIQVKGLTIVPLSLYFNERNFVKIELGIAKGRKLHDKREVQKKRDWDRQKQRLLKGGNA